MPYAPFLEAPREQARSKPATDVQERQEFREYEGSSGEQISASFEKMLALCLLPNPLFVEVLDDAEAGESLGCGDI